MKIFVHVHIYYANMWNELKEYLKNITVPYDMVVTFVDKHPEIEDDILFFKSDAKIMYVENKGWDVGPFISALQSINLNNYDYVIKIHTKRDLPGLFSEEDIPFYYPVRKHLKYKSEWRHELLSFLQDEITFEKCLSAFESDKQLGMTANFKIITDKSEKDKKVYNEAKNLLIKIGYPQEDFKFVAGTMFMVRAKLLTPVLTIKDFIGDFTETKRKDIAVSAHVLERFLGGLVCLQGYEIKDVFTEKQKFGFPFREIAVGIFRFVFQYRVTQSGYKTIKIFKIPIFRKKVISE